MTKFSKNLIVIIFLILASFVVVNFVFAQADLGMEYGEQIGLSNTDPRVIIARVIQVALGFLGIIAVVLIMYAGWLWMTSEGNEEKIEKAKKILKNAVIGLIIILSSFAIASFVLNKLRGATGGGVGGGAGGPGGGAGGGIGVMGSCTVESVYPEPSQQEVPRNTSIIVTFREEVKSETICADTNSNGIFCEAADGDNLLIDADVKNSRVKIYKDNKGAVKAADVTDFIKEVKVVATTDKKTFIFMPSAYLGSPSESMWYTVYLSNGIQKTNGDGIFKTCSKDFLEWQFQVSNKIDLEPPQIKAADKGGISPKPASTKPRNSVIQINFNEAINPITVSGSAEEVKNYIRIVNAAAAPVASGGSCTKDADCVSFKCNAGTCDGENNYLEGRFIVSNQYQTVEFISNNQCGVNGCGEKIYCLPGGSKIKVELKAATLISCVDCAARTPYNICAGGHCQDDTGQNYPLSSLPLSGVADVALNSLDGNRDANPQGPATFYNENSPVADTGDNYQWSFSVSDEIDLSPPVIESVIPGASGANLSEPVMIAFNKLMMSSSLGTGSMEVDNGKDADGNDLIVEHKRINLISAKSTLNPPEPDPVLPGYWIAKSDIDSDGDKDVDKTRVEIRHSMFGDSIKYRAQVGSGVKDSNQNCFKPSSDLSCTGNPSCCKGTPTDSSQCP